MSRWFDRARQALNLLLLFVLIGVVAAAFVWLLTTPEQRDATFWASMGFIGFSLILNFLFMAKIATGQSKNVPVSFAQLLFVLGYMIFVIIAAIVDARVNLSLTAYFLIQIGGLVVFVTPLILMNMAQLKQTGSEREEQAEGRRNLNTKANDIRDAAKRLEISFGAPRERLNPLYHLADSLQYSDPTLASQDAEKNLDAALDDLAAILSSIASPDDAAMQRIAPACSEAEKALRRRNDDVMSRK